MKFNFKKIAAIAGSVLLTGMSAGIASAAAFPQPFVTNGAANVAIVYGTGASAATADAGAYQSIQSALAGSVHGGTTTISGEHIDLQRPSSLLHVGGSVGDVFGRSITGATSDMPNLLKDGVFRDSSNDDHDYTQKIDVANLSLSQFDLSDYDSNVSETTPTIGVPVSSDAEVLNYTLTFQDTVNMSHMANEDLGLMGKNYYVLSASGTSPSTAKMTLLDSGTSASLSGGDSTTLTVGDKSYAVSVDYIDSSKVKLTVNGETTDSLKIGETYKLSDGSYVGIKDVYSNGAPAGSYAAGVDFSIGSGKIELTGGNNVQVNGNSVTGLTSYFTFSNNKLSKLILEWTASDDVAITSSGLTMPVFSGISLTFGGMNYPANEVTKVKPDGNNAIKLSTTVKNGPIDLDILANDNSQKNFTMVGKDSTHLLETSSSNVLNYNGTKSGNSFVVSYNGGTYAESYWLTVDNFVYDSDGTTPLATIKSKDGGSLNQQVRSGDDVTLGDIVLSVSNVDKTTKTITLTGNPGTSFNELYTAEGLQVTLPWVNTTAMANQSGSSVDCSSAGPAGIGALGYNRSVWYNTSGTAAHTYCVSYPSSYDIQFTEEDKDGNIAQGAQFNITVGADSSYRTTVDGVYGLGTGIEEGTSDVYDYVASSALATSVKWDKTSSTQQDATVTYHGGESSGTLTVASSSATVSSSALGDVLVKDSEVSSVSDKNLIIVGGSCINSAAATVLGVSEHTCGAAFTAKTGVGEGQFLIEGIPSSSLTSKLALVVAGYSKEDTANAATYLTKKTVDTSKKYIGTSATEATMQTSSA